MREGCFERVARRDEKSPGILWAFNTRELVAWQGGEKHGT